MSVYLNQLRGFYVWGAKALIFIIPFLSLWIARTMFFPYITGRNFGFLILVEIAFVLWIGLIFLDKSYLPKKSLILWVLLGFILIVGLADIFGVSPFQSFWSRFERMEGYMLLLHMAAYFILLTSVFRTKKDWLIYFNLFVIAGVIAGFYGILQKLGLKPSIQGGFRIDGTIGNPTYFAAYLSLNLIVALILLINAVKKWAKYLYGGAALYFLLIIYLTASRGPALGLAAAVFLFLVLHLIFGKGYKKLAISALALMIVLPLFLVSAKNTKFIRRNPVLQRFAHISLTEKTTRSRFMVWDMARQGFLARPILGWGQENYTYVFSKYYNPKIWDQEPWFDRAHNIIFDWLTNAGALGLLAYLSLFGAAFAIIWSAFKNGKIKFPEAGVLFAGLIAYFVQNLFVFDNFNTYLIFFTLLGYIHSLGQKDEQVKIASPSSEEKRQNRSLTAAAAALVVILPAMYFANVRPIKQSGAIIDLLNSASSGQPAAVLEKAKKAISYNTFGDAEVRDQIVRLALNLIPAGNIADGDKVEFINFAIEEMEKQAKFFPEDLRTRLFLATLYNRSAHLNPQYAQQALTHIDAALKISPTRATGYFILADNYLLRNDFTNAASVLQKAVEIEPLNLEAQYNLARIALLSNQVDLADRVVDFVIAQADEPPDAALLAKLGDLYVQAQRFAKALEIYKKVVEVDPKNYAQYWANLAGLYLNQGFKEEAAAAARRAAEIEPENFGEAVRQFLEQL